MKKRVIGLIAPLFLLTFGESLLAQDAEPKELVVIDLRPPAEREGTGLSPLSGKFETVRVP